MIAFECNLIRWVVFCWLYAANQCSAIIETYIEALKTLKTRSVSQMYVVMIFIAESIWSSFLIFILNFHKLKITKLKCTLWSLLELDAFKNDMSYLIWIKILHKKISNKNHAKVAQKRISNTMGFDLRWAVHTYIIGKIVSLLQCL